MSDFEYKRIKRLSKKKYRALTRRTILRQMVFAGVLVAFPGAFVALAQQKVSKQAPIIPFKPSAEGSGIVGPYGEVKVFDIDKKALPLLVSSVDGLALMDVTGRSAFVRYGKGSKAITLTTDGVKFGNAKVQPWSDDIVRTLIAALARDREKARGAMLLRSALHTSYPIAALKSKLPAEKRVGAVISRGADGYGARSKRCTTTTVTETVTRRLTEVVEVWKTAEQRFQRCYDRTISKNPCKSIPSIPFVSGPAICATTSCSASGFVDILVGVMEIVTTVAEEVTREVVSCVIPKKGEWLNPWNLSDRPLQAAVPQPANNFSSKDIQDALKLLKDLTGFLGVYGECLLKGKWSLAQFDTRLDLGGGNIVIPYGVKVCLDSVCATRLSAENIFLEGTAAWGSALTVLAGLSLEFAAITIAGPVTVGSLFPLSGAITAVIAAASPAVVAVAAIILAFIMLALLWGTAISAQLSVHRIWTDNFADGSVCIEHPTFAIALVELATLGFAPLELFPPIVTG